MTIEPSTDSQKLASLNRELTVLNDIASALNQEVDPDQALNTTLEKVAELLGLRTGWIWLIRDGTEDESYLAAAQNLPPALRDNPHRMEGECYCLKTFRTGDLNGAANVNVVSCSRLSGLVDGTDGLRYHTSVPLYASHGLKLGVLNVAGTEWRELSKEELRLLHTIGDLLSITVERSRLFRRSAHIGAMEERNRLAREIHDTLAQTLAAITLQMETADAHLEAGADEELVSTAVRKALELSRSGLLEARRSVLDLRAVPLEGRTLAEALQALLNEFQARTGVETGIWLVGAHQPLPVRLEVSIFRIAQEALANVEQHARAMNVHFELVVTPSSLVFTVADDGRGFETEGFEDGHYGLLGINERVHLMGGHLNLQSTPETGTQLEISIPLVETDDSK